MPQQVAISLRLNRYLVKRMSMNYTGDLMYNGIEPGRTSLAADSGLSVNERAGLKYRK
jgi:hypothetical protein